MPTMGSDNQTTRDPGTPAAPRFRLRPQPWHAVPALWLLLALCTFNDYGNTWDELINSRYGQKIVDYFLSGGSDRGAVDFFNLQYYGGLYDGATALLSRLGGRLAGHAAAGSIYKFMEFEIRHVANVLCVFLTLIAVGRIAGRLGDNRLLAAGGALALLLLPRFYGHGFANGKDIPFACAFAWAMLHLSELAAGDGGWRRVLAASLCAGLAMAIRIGGLLLFGFAAAAFCCLATARLAGAPADTRAKLASNAMPTVLAKSATFALVAWTVMILPWPFAHARPVAGPMEAFAQMSNFQYVVPMLFEGRQIFATDAPWYYLPKYLVITTPLPLLILAGCGVGAALSGICRRHPGNPTGSTARFAMLLLWLFFPLAYTMVKKPPLYDGIRHFLFILPALGILAGLGLSFITSACLAGGGRRKAAAAGLLAAASILPTVLEMTALHPYQTAYFSSVAGGLRRAHPAYDTDYWMASLKEAAAWLNRRAAELPPGKELSVWATVGTTSLHCLHYYLHPAVRLSMLESQTDYSKLPPPDCIVQHRRQPLPQELAGCEVLHRIGRRGAVFCQILGPAASNASRDAGESGANH